VKRKLLVFIASAILLCCRGTTLPSHAFEPSAAPAATAPTGTPAPTASATPTDTVPLKADCGPETYGPVSADEPVVFDGRGSSTPHGPMRAYQWNFGDGTIGYGVTPTHNYYNDYPDLRRRSMTTFTVTLTIVDREHQTASCTTKCIVFGYY
jgi:hypothetical protein